MSEDKGIGPYGEWEYGLSEDVGSDDLGERELLDASKIVFDHIAILMSSPAGTEAAAYMVDIKNVCTNVTIFEDIGSYHLSGRMTIVDGVDIIKNNKLVGQETVTIKAHMVVPSEEEKEGSTAKDPLQLGMDHTFRIYAISDYTRINDSTASYVLHFTDPMAYEFQQTRINKVLRGRYSDMLALSMQEDAEMKSYLSGKNVRSGFEKTSPENMQLVVPNWNLNRLAQFVVENGDVVDNKSYKNSMFFYQTLMRTSDNDDRYKLQSFQRMCSDEMKHQEVFSYYGRNDQNPANTTETFNLRMTTILSYTKPVKANTLMGVTTGAYASKMVTYDPVRKIHEDVIYSIDDVFSRQDNNSHVQSHPMIRTNEEGIPLYRLEEYSNEGVEVSEMFRDKNPGTSFNDVILHKVNMTNAYSDEEKLIDASGTTNVQQQIGLEYRDAGTLERVALLSLMEQNITRVEIPLRFDMMVGMNVDLILPTAEIKGDNDVPSGDELESLRYVIGKLTYEFSPLNQKGRLSMQCIKESFNVNIDEYNPKGEV